MHKVSRTATSALPWKEQPARRPQDVRKDAQHDRRTYRLENSTVTLEDGPAGSLARVDRLDGTLDYAGPLPEATVDAIREVARDG